MLNAKFIVNLTHLLRNGSTGFFQEFLFKAEIVDDNENIFLYSGMKILEVTEKTIFTQILVDQFDKDLKNIGNQMINYNFNVKKMVSICNKKSLAKNYIELAFVDLYLNLYLKQIHANNFKQKDLFMINKKSDEQALIINDNEITEEQAQELIKDKVVEEFNQENKGE